MKRVLIMGAAGRDFHNFNVYFRHNPDYNVVAFTATQIPDIEGRRYPAKLAGKLYPKGISIESEDDLVALIQEHEIDLVVFSYSDVSHQYVMERASRTMAAGADFMLLGPKTTQLRSNKPVISVTAVRTGAGKSQTTRRVAAILRELGQRVVVVRHPMPYGDLVAQECQRFASYKDLDRYNCTIEEREEYEPHIAQGTIVYAGVDYEKILRMAEREADLIVWDGGNNDFSFYKSDLNIVVADPLRAGHEVTYYPGHVNLLIADVVVINKVDTAGRAEIDRVRESIRAFNPQAKMIEAVSPLFVEDPAIIENKRVLVIEDGPTLTHGEMGYGAATLAAEKFGAREIVDPRPYAVNSIAETFKKYPHMGKLLPAMGYGREQIRDLAKTIQRTPCDAAIIGTPIDLKKLIKFEIPTTRVRYELQEIGHPTLKEIIAPMIH
ncbi:cyclic 2,3-diphosphoglycerate synthase [Candidatus Acetothermia bacterium]|jgi:predicted GTPase|nr:cyclic 2,3-diphosphoglycerate synthase [Candidatus Acetothermia bacterium]MCI2432407.1 cyclic 2,3-diphosphoglycerate synthase [Candidatus Acetothermia bacterium]MCI2436229.1 cyclic 2,3-diphosphoglycerate synthase [Candidatus Acetothermia bacterium]